MTFDSEGSSMDWVLGMAFADVKERSERQRRLDLLDAHIERMWAKLPEQSKRRLGCIAASTGTSVSPEDHARLIGAFALIAESEGVLEEETEFAETYLSVPWVCEAVAESERRKANPKEKAARRREQTRLAVARHREKQKEQQSSKQRRSEEALGARLEAVKGQRAVMVDGEGVSLDDGSHVYRYMAACRSDGTVLGELYDEEGITTRNALEFVANLPKHDEDGVPYLGVFGYGLGYDMTKWLERLKNKPLYELFHSEDLKPKARVGSLSLLLVGKCLEIVDKDAPKYQKRTKVWDILKGFQSTFVKALRDWGVGTKEEWERIEAMKKQRGKFKDAPWEEVTAYCKDECRLGAELVETYIRAHVDAGIDLRGKYHGAGSTSDAFLRLMDALEKKCTREMAAAVELDAYTQMKSAFSRSFFGGRAETSRIGIVRGPVWTADIASAYPHVLFELPCLKHGRWKKVSGRGLWRSLRAAKLATVHFRIGMRDERQAALEDVERPELAELGAIDEKKAAKKKRRKKGEEEDEKVTELDRTIHERSLMTGIAGDAAEPAWCPLPYRTEKGSIVFPACHPGGWSWLPEFSVAEKHYEGVEALEAWVLRGSCQCERPYKDIGKYYLLRIQWGKEGRGKVLKLGYNGCYGKTAQVIGKNPKYSCRAVAGHITGTTRGRLYEAMMSAKDPWNVFYSATDGLMSTEELSPPNPRENETSRATKKWLGVWEVNRLEYKDESGKMVADEGDVFVVQPGFWFSLTPLGSAKTRGAPIDIIYAFRHQILDQWRREPTSKPRGLPKQSTFHGAKSSIRPPTLSDSKYRRDSVYGRWTEEPRRINYVVSPKRSSLADQGDGSYRLRTWWMRPGQPESAEYKKDPSFEKLDTLNDEQPDFVEPMGAGVGE